MTRTKFKKIPFDLELAKKIMNGKVKGRIVAKDGLNARIVCFDLKHGGSKNNIIDLTDCGDYELTLKYEPNGKVTIMQDKYDLHLEVPTYYRDYSNFMPQKWQACIVRDFNYEVWVIRVCSGKDSDGGPTFFNTPSYHYWNYILPLNNVTERLVGTTESYAQLIQELDENGQD